MIHKDTKNMLYDNFGFLRLDRFTPELCIKDIQYCHSDSDIKTILKEIFDVLFIYNQYKLINDFLDAIKQNTFSQDILLHIYKLTYRHQHKIAKREAFIERCL